jgi:hypothetical protein
MIELTGRKYAASWTVEDYDVWALRYRTDPRCIVIDGDKRDADIMLAAMKEKSDAVDPAV